MTTQQNNSLSVDALSAEAQAMHADFAMVDALMGGTSVMRAMREWFLPKFPLEDNTAYDYRLKTSTLLPVYKETVNRMVGRVFARAMTIDDNVPEKIKAICQNVDGQNRNLSVFASDVFETALSYGLSHILVDMPVATGATLADQKSTPYMAHIHPKRILGWREVGGVLTQLRFKSVRSEADGEFGDKKVEVITVLEPAFWRKYERTNDGTEWVVAGEGVNSLGEIPLVTIYTNRKGFMLAEPPLKELAHLNIKHWQSQSDQDKLLHTARVPLLVRIGADDTKNIEGGSSVIDLPIGASLAYVEHSGAAISAGRDSLKELIEEMQLVGAKLLQPNTGIKTATQAREDGADNKSALARMAEGMRDGIDAALQYMAQWLKLPDGGSVDLNTDLDNDSAPIDSMGVVSSMVTGLFLSKKSAFEEARRRGLVNENLNWEDEQARIQGETAAVDGNY